jgi:hypothetical protein
MAEAVIPSAMVAYPDNDPLVLSHAEATLHLAGVVCGRPGWQRRP